MVKLLLQGPSLLTIWRGENAIPTLLKVKGSTQPAEAVARSIRGSFWCDNGVCNLMHTSDDTAKALRELNVLRLNCWLDEEVGQGQLIQPTPVPTTYVAHSGISIVCDVVNRVLLADNVAPTPFNLPLSGGALETNQQLTLHLRATAARYQSVAPFIDAFLAGDVVAVTDMLKSLPVTQWEHFVIQCGTINRERWDVVL